MVKVLFHITKEHWPRVNIIVINGQRDSVHKTRGGKTDCVCGLLLSFFKIFLFRRARGSLVNTVVSTEMNGMLHKIMRTFE